MVIGHIQATCHTCGRRYTSGDCIRFQCHSCELNDIQKEALSKESEPMTPDPAPTVTEPFPTPFPSVIDTVTVPREEWEERLCKSAVMNILLKEYRRLIDRFGDADDPDIDELLMTRFRQLVEANGFMKPTNAG